MIDLIEYLTKGVVSNPDEVSIVLDEENSNDRQKIYLITVNPNDMGELIGKSGKTINSIRTIVKIKAKKEGYYVDLKIVEPETSESEEINTDSDSE